MIRKYYYLTKPGIIYGNAITATAGFFLASKNDFDWRLFLGMLGGLSLVIASACVFNNLWDRDIDSQMIRTKNRSIVTGSVSKLRAFLFAVILIILGVVILHFHTNPLALSVGLLGFFVYLFLYTPMKRRSVHATLVGAIAGATPPVAGYTAVTNQLDLGAWILFFILVAWQMPHFYAIGIRRLDEYRQAGIPILPAVEGIGKTKKQIFIYIIIFVIVVASLKFFGYAGWWYLAGALGLGLAWLMKALRTWHMPDDKLWARQMFFFSLWVLLGWSLSVIIDALIL